jgi:hypothetical protein
MIDFKISIANNPLSIVFSIEHTYTMFALNDAKKIYLNKKYFLQSN